MPALRGGHRQRRRRLRQRGPAGRRRHQPELRPRVSLLQAPSAGPHMVSEAESRALMAWIVAHRNVAAILTFGESDNLDRPADERRTARSGPRARPRPLRRAPRPRAPVGRVHPDRRGHGLRPGRADDDGRVLHGDAHGRRRRPAAAGRQTQAAESGRFMMPDRKPATTVATADYDYFKAVERQVHRADRDPPASLRPRAPGRLLPVRVLPVRRPVVLDARLRPDDGRTAGRAGWAWRPPGAARPGRRPRPAGRPAGVRRRRRGDRPSSPRAGPRDDDDADGPGGGRRLGPGRGRGVRRDARHRQAGPQVAGRREDRRLRQVDEGQAPRVRRGRDRRLQALRLLPIRRRPSSPSSAPPTPSSPCTSSSLFPRVKVASFEAVAHGGGLFRIKAEVENAGFWPTSLAQGQTARSVKPTMVRLGVEPGDDPLGQRQDELPAGPGRLGQPGQVRMAHQGQGRRGRGAPGAVGEGRVGDGPGHPEVRGGRR
ncbi:MAG: hypothetical protein MZW92_62185 [Comamonadaceae bacterium]|nr:hypothetical protein [Comamonadaceae bacterium]